MTNEQYKPDEIVRELRIKHDMTQYLVSPTKALRTNSADHQWISSRTAPPEQCGRCGVTAKDLLEEGTKRGGEFKRWPMCWELVDPDKNRSIDGYAPICVRCRQLKMVAKRKANGAWFRNGISKRNTIKVKPATFSSLGVYELS